MMTQFFFALTNSEAESLLKLEVLSHFPSFKLSYSRPGFLTFKGDSSGQFNPLMARLSGKCLGKFQLDELKYKKAWVWKRDEKFTIPSELAALSDQSLFKVGETVTLIMMVGLNEYWVGEYQLQSHHFQTPGEVSSIEVRSVPSRAYYKIAEAHEAFDLPFEEDEIVLELGSAPGGASLFLLDQELNVLGVDPAEMDPVIRNNIRFKHLKRPFETLRSDDFRNGVDWIISDINLPPTVVLKEVERLLTFLKPKGLVLTLKLNQEKHLNSLKYTVKNFESWGFENVRLKYLPSHRQEIALIVQHS